MVWDNFISQDTIRTAGPTAAKPKFSIPTCSLKVPRHHKHTHTERCKELSNGICPPPPPPPDQLRLGLLCTTSGNTWPSARQTPGAGSSTHRSTDYAPPLRCGHLKFHLHLSGIGQSQWSCPSPS